jgi:tellurite resistance protein TehA-like permease
MNILYIILQNDEIYRTETDVLSTFPGSYMIIINLIILLISFFAGIYLYILVVKYLKLKIKKLKKDL